VIGYSGEFSLAKVEKFGENVRLNLAPYFQAQGDVLHTNCSGLSSPPYASFATWGSAAANQAVVDFAAADVSAGPLTFNVAPTSVLPPGCSDLLGSFEAPCSQSSTWSGQVTVARAGV
jgi:hypothetical protein